MNANDVARVLETVFSIPTMEDKVKIDLKISRRTILMLSSVIDRGLDPKDETAAALLDNINEEMKLELRAISDECIQRTGLADTIQKVKNLSNK